MIQEKIWLKLRSSFWFLPTIYGVIAIILSFLVHKIDSWLIDEYKDALPNILLTHPEVAKELYSALVTAILTLTTISISVIMAVLTTYSSQFSPRTLQDFMRSSSTHHVLGFYSFGFIFALLHLIMVDKNNLVAGPILMGVIAIVILGIFIYFIHYSSNWVHVNHLISKLRADGARVIKNNNKPSKHYLGFKHWNQAEIKTYKKQISEKLTAKKSGYIQSMDFNDLVSWAKKYETIIFMNVQVGAFVFNDYPLAYIVTINNDKPPMKELHEHIIIDSERTDLLDIEFSIQKLVDIALKAISPAVNDPHTAINCINRMGELLHELTKGNPELLYLTDKQQQIRCILKQKKFEDYLYKSFYQIRHYGKHDISIMYGILEVLYKLSVVSDEQTKHKIWSFHFYIIDVIQLSELSALDAVHFNHMYDAFKTCHDKK